MKTGSDAFAVEVKYDSTIESLTSDDVKAESFQVLYKTSVDGVEEVSGV